MYIVLAASFIGYWSFLGQKYPRIYAVLPFVILSSFLSLLYVAGLFGALALGRAAILYCGLLLLAVALLRSVKNAGASFRALLAPGVVGFAVLFLVGLIQLGHTTLYGWDEIGNWASYSKELFTSDALIGPQGVSQIRYYPPGLMLIHYYLFNYNGYSESILYFAQFISIVACLLVLLHNAAYRYPLALAAAVLSSYFVVQGLEGGFVNLYQDTALSVFFAATIISYYILQSAALEHLLIPSVFALPVVKPIGIFFGLAVVSIIVLDKLILALASTRAPGPRAPILARVKDLWNIMRRIPAQRLLILALLMVAPVLARESWTIRMRVLKIADGGFTTNLLTLDNIKKTFVTTYYENHLDDAARAREAGQLGVIRKVRQTFVSALSSTPVNSVDPDRVLFLPKGLSLVSWYWIICGVFAYAILGRAGAMPMLRYGVLFLWLSILLLVYIFLHILVYALTLYAFSALTLDSYDRLMAIFMGAFLLVGFACAIVPIEDLAGRNPFPVARGLGVAVLAVALLIVQAPVLDRLIYPQEKTDFRKSMEPMLHFVLQHVGAKQKVYIVAQNTTGFAYWVLRYELIPRPVNPWNWTLGRVRCANDLWDYDISANQWASLLTGGKFEFVLVSESNDEFWTRYRGLFQKGATDGAAVFLYKVEGGEPQAMRLIPVAEAEQRDVPPMMPDTASYGINLICRN